MKYITEEVRGVERLTAVSFGGQIECGGVSCTEYTGVTPAGYTSLGQWYEENAEQLGCWTVNAEGNLERLADPGEEPQGTVSAASVDWNYCRRPDGRVELWADVPVEFMDSTELSTGVHRSIVSLDLSEVITKILAGSCPWQRSGHKPEVCRNGTTQSTAEVCIFSHAAFTGFTATIPLYIIGI